ncbi:hypothetical protein ES705_05795 [subsurface metagenome]
MVVIHNRLMGLQIDIDKVSATNGYWNWQDPIKAIMVGADNVQTCTAIMIKGV